MANPTRTAQIRLDADHQVAVATHKHEEEMAALRESVKEEIAIAIRSANAERDTMRDRMASYTDRVADLADKAIAMDRANDQMLKVFVRARQKAQKSLWAIREGNTAAGADFCNWIHRAMQSERDRIQKQMKDYRPIVRPSIPTEPLEEETVDG